MSITVGQLVAALDEAFPLAWAEPWDRVGLCVGDAAASATRAFVTLDPTLDAIKSAKRVGADVIVTHHPPFLGELQTVTAADPAGRLILAAAASGIALVAMHTNLDRSPEGAEVLAVTLGLLPVQPLEPGLPDLDPRSAHPCGEAPVSEASESPVSISGEIARLGRLCETEPVSLAALAGRVGERLGVVPRVWGDPDRMVSKVAVSNGSGSSLLEAAMASGADAMVTGEVRYHGALDAAASGLAIIEAGHDATEWPLVSILADAVRRAMGEDRVVQAEPHTGWWTSGRAE